MTTTKTKPGTHLRAVMSVDEWESVAQMLELAAERYDANAQDARRYAQAMTGAEPAHALITARGAHQLAEMNEQSAAKARRYAKQISDWAGAEAEDDYDTPA